MIPLNLKSFIHSLPLLKQLLGVSIYGVLQKSPNLLRAKIFFSLGHPYYRNITWTPLWSEYYMVHIIWDTTVKGDLTVNYRQILTLE